MSTLRSEALPPQTTSLLTATRSASASTLSAEKRDSLLWRVILSFTIVLGATFVLIGTGSTRYDWLALVGRAPLLLVWLTIRLMMRRRWWGARLTAAALAVLSVAVLAAGLTTKTEPYLSSHCPPSARSGCIELPPLSGFPTN